MAQELAFAVSLDLFMDKNFDKGFKGLNNALTTTAEKVKALSDTSQKMTGFAAMAQKCQTLTASTGETQGKLDVLKTRTAEVDGYISRNAENTARLSSRYSALKSEADRLSSSGQKNTAMYQKVAQRMKQVKAELKGSQAEGKRLADMQKSLNSESSKLERSLNADTEALNKMKAELQSAGVNTEDLANEQARLTQQAEKAEAAQLKLASAQAKLNGIKQNLSWDNVKGTVLGGFATYKALEAPVKTSMDFEAAMQRVKAVSFSSDDADMSKFEMLKAQAKQLGADTQFSATQAAQTQENLARGGFDPDQIKAAMPAVLAMAAAEGMDLAQAGDIVVKTIGGMGLKAEDSGMVADLLANVSANAATNIAEVGEGMKIAAPVLSQLGVNLDQLGAYLGGMANKGFVGSEAGNALASSAMRLSKMPTETAKALNALGVPIKTKDGKLRELPDIMKALNTAFNKRKLGEADRMDYLARIFGQGHGKAMLGFMDASVSGDMERLQASNENTKAGKAQKMADIQLDTLAGQLTVLGSAWEGLQISIGDMFSPIVREGVELLSNAISKLNGIITEFPAASKNIAMFIAAIAGAKTVKRIFSLGKSLVELPFAIMKVQSANAEAAGSLSSVMQAGSSLTGAFSGVSSIGEAFKVLWGIIAANPFTAILTVGALIYANWDTIQQAWHSLVDWWNNLDLKDLWASVKDYAAKAWEWYSWPYRKLYEWLSSFELPDIFAAMSDMASKAIDSIKGLFSSFGTWIMDTIGKLNPFNWELPSWLGGNAKATPEQAEAGKAAAKAQFGTQDLRPSYMRHAEGGILTRPHMGLVAEAGAEAVIPLTDKSRGLQVLAQAADILGVQLQPDISGGDIGGSVSNLLGNSSANSVSNLLGGNSSSAVSNLLGESQSITELSRSIMNAQSQSQQDASTTKTLYQQGSPQVNITVNAEGNNDNQGLAEMIAQKVKDAWLELQERQARLDFA